MTCSRFDIDGNIAHLVLSNKLSLYYLREKGDSRKFGKLFIFICYSVIGDPFIYGINIINNNIIIEEFVLAVKKLSGLIEIWHK
jgi:hypothetical protein